MPYPSMDPTTEAGSSNGCIAVARAGITLIEVLVSLMLLSLLAAAVFPVVTQRVSRGEPLRASQELGGVAAAIAAFGGDMQDVLPADLDDLVAPVNTSDRGLRRSGEWEPFRSSELQQWKGPYLDAALVDGGSLTTGFGVPIHDDFIRFDAVNSAPSGAPRFDLDGAGLYVALRIGSAGRQLTVSQFEAINDLVDGPGEPDGPGANHSWTMGMLRFDNSLIAADTIAYYLAAPATR